MNEELLRRKSDPKYDEDLVNKRYVDEKSNVENNGEYFKFPGGTLICSGSFGPTSVGATSGKYIDVTLPYQFIDDKYKVIVQMKNAGEYWSWANTNITHKSASTFRCNIYNDASGTISKIEFDYITIGRWK